MSVVEFAAMANLLRRDVITMTTAASSGHPTSCLSCAEIVNTLFFSEMRWDPAEPDARDVDEFILSKGHAAPILWAVLHRAGAINEPLESLRRIDSTLEGHPTPRNSWVKVATGSLGQGLAAANGIALAKRLDGIDGHVFFLLGDGECSEGAVWEAAQFASAQELGNLVAIVDMNGMQQSERTPCERHSEILAQRFAAFGWKSVEIDGHSVGEVAAAMAQKQSAIPLAIIARTVKGKGVSFLEDKAGLHGKPLSAEQCERALAEIPNTVQGMEVVPRRVASSSTACAVEAKRPLLALNYQVGEQIATRAASC